MAGSVNATATAASQILRAGGIRLLVGVAVFVLGFAFFSDQSRGAEQRVRPNRTALSAAAETSTAAAPGSKSFTETVRATSKDSAEPDRLGQAGRSAAVLWLLVAQCGLIILASFLGGCLPRWIALTHTHMQLMISFVGGLMLGIGLLHLLPHAAVMLGSLDRAVLWTVLGTMATFFLLRTFHFHHHEPEVVRPSHWEPPHSDETSLTEVGTHPGRPHDSEKENVTVSHGGWPVRPGERKIAALSEASWIGVAFGLGVHTLVDGAALAASVQADAHRALPLSMLGLGTFVAILLHKPLDALSIVSLMELSGRSPRAAQAVNLAYCLMCPIGALLFVAGVRISGPAQGTLLGCGLAFAAGVFLCIAMSDLLPELEFHAHDRLPLSGAIVAGVLLAYLIGFLEPSHQHEPRNRSGDTRVSRPSGILSGGGSDGLAAKLGRTARVHSLCCDRHSSMLRQSLFGSCPGAGVSVIGTDLFAAFLQAPSLKGDEP
ncbi:MAG: ZIP family metal transporter [Planctomycetes bacterium]|nr:ZIP family metal transporter [Planctomycetota bacterium]